MQCKSVLGRTGAGEERRCQLEEGHECLHQGPPEVCPDGVGQTQVQWDDHDIARLKEEEAAHADTGAQGG
jgi:hypothetical protein